MIVKAMRALMHVVAVVPMAIYSLFAGAPLIVVTGGFSWIVKLCQQHSIASIVFRRITRATANAVRTPQPSSHANV